MQDGYKEFGQAGEVLRRRLRIQWVDKYGEAEAGVDGGGLFKDFMESIVREGFDPNRGLFRSTAENRLYPNPAVNQVVPGGLHYINFLGKIVGKALYEVRPQFPPLPPLLPSSRTPRFFLPTCANVCNRDGCILPKTDLHYCEDESVIPFVPCSS